MLLVSRAAAEVMIAQEPRSFCHSRTGAVKDLGRGCIINITSVMSYAGIPGKVAYMASKHAAIGVTKASGEYLLFRPSPSDAHRSLSPDFGASLT